MAIEAGTASAVHAVFEFAGIAAGAWLYRRTLRRQGQGSPLDPHHYAVLVGLLAGAAIGNKLVFLVERPSVWERLLAGEWLLPGQSLVGGLLGGLLGVELAKRLTGQTRSTGDALVLPLGVGIALGRIGCFVAGLHDDTYGLPTTLPWGVDLGDGLPRHPAPLYEIGVVAMLLAVLGAGRARLAAVPGLRFKLFLAAYLAWRLLGDLLKPVREPYPLGGSGIQWVCALALALYLPLVWRSARQRTPGLRPASDPP